MKGEGGGMPSLRLFLPFLERDQMEYLNQEVESVVYDLVAAVVRGLPRTETVTSLD
jgi:hypothetical protein